MPLSDQEKQAMLIATHETALAFADDIQHVREVISKPEPTPGDIRRISNPLRRILIDNNGDIKKVAPPRIGRIELLGPDILKLVRSGEKQPFAFLAAGVADVFGITVDAFMAEPSGVNEARKISSSYEPGKIVPLRVDTFLSQKVICFEGQWVSRADVIKYIANIAHGVHSGDPKEPNHELLKRIRYVATMKLDGSLPTLSFNPQAAVAATEKPLAIDRSALDFVLIQLISTARYLVISPDVHRLEEIIKAPTTRVRRRISFMIRSSGLLVRIFCQWMSGKA
jgi:hypothetical protein